MVERHFEILQSFIDWRPQITRNISFGFNDANEKFDSVYPDQKELLVLKDQRLKLCAIHYMNEKDIGSLHSIQLEFASGFKAPIMQARDARDNKEVEVKTMKIDLNRTVRQISVKVRDKKITGLSLKDGNDEIIVEHTWGSKTFGRWVTQKIPVGHEIIGV